MVAGAFRKAGFFMGSKLLPAMQSNPKGFYEDKEINRINEILLAQVLPRRNRLFGRWQKPNIPGPRQRWLARIPLNTEIVPVPKLDKRIKKIVKQEPFCFKDPRFCYTLPVWRPFLTNTAFICVFREPTITVQSLIKECHERPYLRNFYLSFSDAVDLWTLMYSHVVKIHRFEGDWIFLHYQQLFEDKGIARLEQFAGADIDRSFPDRKLQRTQAGGPVPDEAESLYRQLCRLAGYRCENPVGKI